jgi:pimeloyl-ACP methyl ester carboxylesterase
LIGLATALKDWIKTMGLRRARFVANSFGRQILAQLAARFPETVDRLVLQSCRTDLLLADITP